MIIFLISHQNHVVTPHLNRLLEGSDLPGFSLTQCAA